MQEPGPAHIEVEGISKQFGGVRALDDVSLSIPAGAIHALVGENGAGKSTLGKIVAGVLAQDEGIVRLRGEEVAFRSPREALDRGIAMIAQELAVVPQLSVAQNVFLGAEPRQAGWVRRGALRKEYEQLAERAGFTLPADRVAGRMRPAEQQQVEILRALSRDAELIVMDEPSAALSGPDTERLHEIIRSLAKSGTTILLVSHFLREVLELADSVTILRDGKLVRTRPASAESEDSLIQGMLGRPLGAAFPDKPALSADAPVALSVRELSAPGVAGASLEVREGEIVGVRDSWARAAASWRVRSSGSTGAAPVSSNSAVERRRRGVPPEAFSGGSR